MATEKKHALYLMPVKDGVRGRAVLVHADDVEDRRKEGYVDPIGQKANGEAWNAEDDLPGQDAAAESDKRNAERKSKKDAEKLAELEKARKEQEALPKPQDRPDMKVQIVEAPKDTKAKK